MEIDGYEIHIDRETFEHDRRRQNLLVTQGWLVLRFTWRMVVDEPAIVISTILRAIGLLTENGPSRGGYSRR